MDLDAIEAQVSDRHWLMVGPLDGRIVGCCCGFTASEDDCGYGDSVIGHVAAVTAGPLIAEVRALRARCVALQAVLDRK